MFNITLSRNYILEKQNVWTLYNLLFSITTTKFFFQCHQSGYPTATAMVRLRFSFVVRLHRLRTRAHLHHKAQGLGTISHRIAHHRHSRHIGMSAYAGNDVIRLFADRDEFKSALCVVPTKWRLGIEYLRLRSWP